MGTGKKRKNAEGYEQFTRKDGSKDWRPTVKPAAAPEWGKQYNPFSDFYPETQDSETKKEPEREPAKAPSGWVERETPKSIYPKQGIDPEKERKLEDDYVLDVIEIARSGYALDRLADHRSHQVRMEVAKHGRRLEKLVDDRTATVRAEVAKQGYGLDQLSKDSSPEVRIEVAKLGRNIESLADDKNWSVREAVAQSGQFLDKLINDPVPQVREAAWKAEVMKKPPLRRIVPYIKKYLNM